MAGLLVPFLIGPYQRQTAAETMLMFRLLFGAMLLSLNNNRSDDCIANIGYLVFPIVMSHDVALWNFQFYTLGIAGFNFGFATLFKVNGFGIVFMPTITLSWL